MENQRDFCNECRGENELHLKKIQNQPDHPGKGYTFEITATFCKQMRRRNGLKKHTATMI